MAYKIMVVDDEKMLTGLLSDHLRDNGYLPYVANSAQEALEQLLINLSARTVHYQKNEMVLVYKCGQKKSNNL